MTDQKKKLIKEIVEEITKKGYARFNYGGYVFLPNGDIKKRSAYHTSIKRGQNPLVVQCSTSTMETMMYFGEQKAEGCYFNIDTYLLVDALNALKDRSSLEEHPYGQWDAEWEYQKESEDGERSRIAEELLVERSIVFKYVKGVSQLPIPETFEITLDQEKYFKRFDEWAIAAGNYPAVKALKDLMDKITASREKLKHIIEYTPSTGSENKS